MFVLFINDNMNKINDNMNKISKDMIFKIFSYLTKYEQYLLSTLSKRLTKCFKEYEDISGYIYSLVYSDCENPECRRQTWSYPKPIGYCKHYSDMWNAIEKYAQSEIKESSYICEVLEGTKRYIDYTHVNIISKEEPKLVSDFIIKYISDIPYVGRHFNKGIVEVYLLNEFK